MMVRMGTIIHLSEGSTQPAVYMIQLGGTSTWSLQWGDQPQARLGQVRASGLAHHNVVLTMQYLLINFDQRGGGEGQKSLSRKLPYHECFIRSHLQHSSQHLFSSRNRFKIIHHIDVNVSSNVPTHFNNFSTNMLSRKSNLLSVAFSSATFC